MPYIHFTEDQKLRANSVDLVEFLRRQGEKLISSGQDKRLTSDHSIILIMIVPPGGLRTGFAFGMPHPRKKRKFPLWC